MRTKDSIPTTKVMPVLRYRDLAGAISWLCDAFGFHAYCVVRAADGSVVYAQLTMADSMIMLGPVGDAGFDALMKQPDEVGGAETQISYFVVADADAHYGRAKAAGAQIALDLADYNQGGRGYSCHDPEGHAWSFGTYDPWIPAPSGGGLSRSVGSTRWSTHALLAAALTMTLAGAAAAGWMLASRAPNSALPEAQPWLASQLPDEPADRSTPDSERLSQTQDREAEALRLAEEAQQRATYLDEVLQAALVSKDAAIQAAATLDRDLQTVIAAKLTAEQRVSQLTAELEREQAAVAGIGRTLRDTRQEHERERGRYQEAEQANELQRQRLLDQLAIAEAARHVATEELQELVRSRAAATLDQPSVSKSPQAAGGTAMPSRGAKEPKSMAKRLPGRVANETDNPRRAGLRRKCAEIRGNPDDYETALVDLCRTL